MGLCPPHSQPPEPHKEVGRGGEGGRGSPGFAAQDLPLPVRHTPSANHCASTYPSVEGVIMSTTQGRGGRKVGKHHVVVNGPQSLRPSTLSTAPFCIVSTLCQALGMWGKRRHTWALPGTCLLPYPPPLCRNLAGWFWKTQPLSPLRAFALVGSTPKHPLSLTYPNLLSVPASLGTPSMHLPACGHLNFSLRSVFFTSTG